MSLSICVLLPACNEELTIAATISSVRENLPTANILVGINNCTDNTEEIVRKLGIPYVRESRAGKGWMMRTLFEQAPDVDLYLMCDSDNTYDLSSVSDLIPLFNSMNIDCIVGYRLYQFRSQERVGHLFGNRFFRYFFKLSTGCNLRDPFTGFRIYRRSFVKSVNLVSEGFEIESELNLVAHQLSLFTHESPIDYFKRVDGSSSKLNTISDGLKILFFTLWMMRTSYPRRFGFIVSLPLILLGSLLLLRVVLEYLSTGLVLHIPSAIVGGAILNLGFIILFSYIIIASITRLSIDLKKLSLRSFANQDQRYL